MTIVEWIPLFMNPNIVSILYESLRFDMSKRQVILYAYVVMENHLHLIASAPELSKTMKEFKSFTDRSIIDFLKEQKSNYFLEKLKWAKLPYKTQSDYQVWQEGNHPQKIYGEEMMRQKIEYIHNNPVRRGYVDKPKYCRYSSACNYEGLDGLIEVYTDW